MEKDSLVTNGSPSRLDGLLFPECCARSLRKSSSLPGNDGARKQVLAGEPLRARTSICFMHAGHHAGGILRIRRWAKIRCWNCLLQCRRRWTASALVGGSGQLLCRPGTAQQPDFESGRDSHGRCCRGNLECSPHRRCDPFGFWLAQRRRKRRQRHRRQPGFCCAV